VPAHVAERVVPHDREVAQRIAVLDPEGRHLLAQTVDVLGQRVGAGRVPLRRLATEGDDRQRPGGQGHQDRDDIEDPHAERA
jgi:hypothetical protein